MKIANDTVIFKSSSRYFQKEASGKKPNTVRLLTEEELVDLQNHKPTTIKIECGNSYITRDLTDVSIFDQVLDKTLVVFSWHHDPTMGYEPNPTPSRLIVPGGRILS